ncbi:MAG: hypothetical protein WBL85_02575 [Sedimentisphaerales bacterium]
MRTLLRVPDLIEAIEPLVGTRIVADDVFRLIGSGDIKPLGVVQRTPVFDLDQIAGIAEVIRQAAKGDNDDR